MRVLTPLLLQHLIVWRGGRWSRCSFCRQYISFLYYDEAFHSNACAQALSRRIRCHHRHVALPLLSSNRNLDPHDLLQAGRSRCAGKTALLLQLASRSSTSSASSTHTCIQDRCKDRKLIIRPQFRISMGRVKDVRSDSILIFKRLGVIFQTSLSPFSPECGHGKIEHPKREPRSDQRSHRYAPHT